MDTTLVTVTLLSMGMAAALSVIVWRMLRDERQRSEARVVHLAMAANHRAAVELPPVRMDVPAADDVPAVPDRSVATRTSLFAEPPLSSPWGHRLAVMTGLALVLASVVLFALAANGARASAAAAAPAAAPGAKPSAAAPGLELVSLRDSRHDGALTITGLVRNPAGAAPRQRVTVTAYTFDDKGSFLASGRALIDVTSLAGGDESPFVVAVPVTDTVARYRIGFRADDGSVISHVDKRQQGPIAANW
jgi:hypothetical protein